MQQILMGLLAILPVQAETMDKVTDSFEICMQQVLKQQPGQIIKVEKKNETGMQIYEFDVRGNDGRDWDIECVQASGEIWEVEREVQNPNDPLFKANVKVGEKAARKIVLENYPGHIREVEYEVEASGGISLDNIRQIAETGVERISVGALTKDIQALDLSLRFI